MSVERYHVFPSRGYAYRDKAGFFVRYSDYAALEAKLAEAERKLGEATKYACRLAAALHAKHYAHVEQWRPLDGDLIGLLTQIDNMTSGLCRALSDAGRTDRDGGCQALMADIARERARAEAAESRVKALEADLRDEQGHVKRLQKALAFWMPGVSPEIEEELNGRAGDDACLLAGYDGEHEEECWGDTMVSRVKALEEALQRAALAPVEAK